MRKLFGTDHYGKRHIVSHYDHCSACHRLAALCSYTTVKFINLRQFPLIPLGKPIHIIDECPYCGQRSSISHRKYRKKRKEDLAVMMEGFTSKNESPYAALNGLQTLMVYNEEAWFLDVMQSYGQRFETHMVVQLLIAQGLCRFGHYQEAETYSRKAIVLGAGPHGEDLLSLCQSQLEKKEAGHLEPATLLPESMLRPYAFIVVTIASFIILLVANGISATHNHTIWLVNGTPIPYSVEIDGDQYKLSPYGRKHLKVRLGSHQMQAHGLPSHTSPLSFDYKISLLKQKFAKHTLVLNPDAMAVMVAETQLKGKTTNRFQFGNVINELENIDHPFSTFPVWTGSKNSAQTRLFNHVPSNHLEMVEFLRTHMPNDASEYARRALVIDLSGTETENLLKIATSDLPTEQTLEFLQRGTVVFPPLLKWHIFYQNFVEARQPESDLQTEYALLCKAHPDSPEYYYLLGRVALNHATAKLFFEKSEKGSGSHGLGYHAIAYDLLCSGQFKEALPYSKKALEQSPNHPKFKELDQEVHLALREYDHALQQVQTHLRSDPGNGKWVADKIKYLTLIGEHKAAARAMSSFPDSEKNWNTYFQAVRFYVSGNVSAYLENLLESGRDNAELQQLLHTGNVEAAHDLLGGNDTHEYTSHLILYCAAMHHGHPEIAKTEMAKAIAETGALTLAQRGQTLILSNETPPTIKEVLDLRITPKEKALLCASLGFKFPNQRRDFFNLVRKFNYTPEHPQLLLKKWTR